jgi:hypothetical protein
MENSSYCVISKLRRTYKSFIQLFGYYAHTVKYWKFQKDVIQHFKENCKIPRIQNSCKTTNQSSQLSQLKDEIDLTT